MLLHDKITPTIKTVIISISVSTDEAVFYLLLRYHIQAQQLTFQLVTCCDGQNLTKKCQLQV